VSDIALVACIVLNTHVGPEKTESGLASAAATGVLTTAWIKETERVSIASSYSLSKSISTAARGYRGRTAAIDLAIRFRIEPGFLSRIVFKFILRWFRASSVFSACAVMAGFRATASVASCAVGERPLAHRDRRLFRS